MAILANFVAVLGNFDLATLDWEVGLGSWSRQRLRPWSPHCESLGWSWLVEWWPPNWKVVKWAPSMISACRRIRSDLNDFINLWVVVTAWLRICSKSDTVSNKWNSMRTENDHGNQAAFAVVKRGDGQRSQKPRKRFPAVGKWSARPLRKVLRGFFDLSHWWLLTYVTPKNLGG